MFHSSAVFRREGRVSGNPGSCIRSPGSKLAPRMPAIHNEQDTLNGRHNDIIGRHVTFGETTVSFSHVACSACVGRAEVRTHVDGNRRAGRWRLASLHIRDKEQYLHQQAGLQFVSEDP